MQNAFSGKSADDHQGLSGLNRGALRNRQLFHSTVAGGEDFILHLHRLKHQNCLLYTSLPLIGASLAKRVFAPGCQLIVESGLMDCSPIEVPRSVGDLRSGP